MLGPRGLGRSPPLPFCPPLRSVRAGRVSSGGSSEVREEPVEDRPRGVDDVTAHHIHEGIARSGPALQRRCTRPARSWADRPTAALPTRGPGPGRPRRRPAERSCVPRRLRSACRRSLGPSGRSRGTAARWRRRARARRAPVARRTPSLSRRGTLHRPARRPAGRFLRSTTTVTPIAASFRYCPFPACPPPRVDGPRPEGS